MRSRRLFCVSLLVASMAALGGCGASSDGEPPSRLTNQTQTSWPTQGETGDVNEPVTPASTSVDP